jgi:hypothetical protein
MSANKTLSQPQLVSLPRTERKRARLEDFEMIERTRAATQQDANQVQTIGRPPLRLAPQPAA